MSDPIELKSGDQIVKQMHFRPYRNVTERQAVQYRPQAGEPDDIPIKTPWGETLNCFSGDYIVNEVDAPDDRWPVKQDIFEESYVEVRPGHYVKRAVTYLVPLVDLTRDPEQKVTIFTLEGAITVRSGDFYLARGIRGEIWPFPKEKVLSTLKLLHGDST